MNDDNLTVRDAKGNWANITITNVNQSNGVIHVIDRVTPLSLLDEVRNRNLLELNAAALVCC